MLHRMLAAFMLAVAAHNARALSLVHMRVTKESGAVGESLREDAGEQNADESASVGASERQDLWRDVLEGSAKQQDVAGAAATTAPAWNDMGTGPNTAPILRSDDGKEWVNWTLCNVSVHNNLAGLGPDSGEESIRYYNIATTEGGQNLDLVITANTSYLPKSTSSNGLVRGDGCFGALNLKSIRNGGYNEVDLLFTTYLSGTNTSVAMNEVYLTVFDFDSGSDATEHATFYKKVDGIFYVPDHEMDIQGDESTDIGITFSSTQQGTGADNPKDPNNLTPLQKRRAVMVRYKEHAQWKITIAVSGGKGGRNFAFGGFSNIMATTTTTTCEPQSCTVWADPHISGFDNVDNQGPTHLALISARRTLAATFDRRPMDVNAYDDGDFWLVKSDTIHIQARFRLSGEFIPDRAAIGAVAVGGPFLDGHKFIVEPLDGQVTFDDVELPGDVDNFRDGSGQVSVLLLSDGYMEAKFPMNVKLSFKRLAKHVDVTITMPPIPGGIDGECGNFDGIAENDGEDSILGRMGDLRIADSMLLFAKKADEVQLDAPISPAA